MNLKCSPTPLQHQNHRPRGGCGRLRGGYGRLRILPSTQPDLAGVPDGLCRGKEVFLVPGKTWPASLTSSEPSGRLRPPAKFSWYPARLGRRPWRLPRPRKRSAACFDAFRALGNVQRRVLELSEPSETFSGVFWYFPRPRGGCGRLRSFPGTRPDLAGVPDAFRALGAAAAACESIRVRVWCTRPAWPASLTPFTPPRATIAQRFLRS